MKYRGAKSGTLAIVRIKHVQIIVKILYFKNLTNKLKHQNQHLLPLDLYIYIYIYFIHTLSTDLLWVSLNANYLPIQNR